MQEKFLGRNCLLKQKGFPEIAGGIRRRPTSCGRKRASPCAPSGEGPGSPRSPPCRWPASPFGAFRYHIRRENSTPDDFEYNLREPEPRVAVRRIVPW